MRVQTTTVLLLLSLTATSAFASGGSPPPSAPSNPSPGSNLESTANLTPRQQAEQWYGDSYDDITKAKETLAAETPDPKKAEKLFKRAIDRAARALEYDKNYYEALNLQGYAYRKLGNFEKSIDAYAACLRIEPDYAPAREYYGETLLASGDVDGAKAQLVWLKRLRAEDLAKELEASIAAAAAPKADAAKPAKSDKAAPKESAGSKDTGKGAGNPR
jgi:tetratricopeptide (TPR) repeat protein